MAALRQHLVDRLHGASAAYLNGETFEAAYRATYGMIRIDGRMDGLIDAFHEPGVGRKGRGIDCKTQVVKDRASRDRIWPESLPNDAVVMPGPGNGTLVQIDFEHARISCPIGEKLQMMRADPADAGSWLMDQVRRRYEKGVAKCKVRAVGYAFLFRHPDGGLLAFVEAPMTLPLRRANDLDWHWQVKPLDEPPAGDDYEPTAEPTCLEGWDREGCLVVRWYVQGNQVRERALLDPATFVRFRV